jgi:hypothetical protein
MSRDEMIINLVQVHAHLEELLCVAEKGHMPTAITMGLTWLRDDTVKVIADLDPRFEMPED